MIVKTCIAAAGLLALAACGSSGSEGNGSSSTSARGGGAVQLQPGEWEMKMEVLSVNAPGLPPAVVAQMKQPTNVTRDCMTPEEAKAPKSDMLAGSKSGNCKQEGFEWSGGRIHGVTTCQGQGAGGAGKMTMTMDGQYSPTSMDMTIKTDTQASGVGMQTEMRMTGHRVGECPAQKAG